MFLKVLVDTSPIRDRVYSYVIQAYLISKWKNISNNLIMKINDFPLSFSNCALPVRLILAPEYINKKKDQHIYLYVGLW